MSDPRGHGFNRGRGKWHAPMTKVIEVDPTELGWFKTEDGSYKLGDVDLRPFEFGWLYTQRATIGGIERKSEIYVGPVQLPDLTAVFIADLKEAAYDTRAYSWCIIDGQVELWRRQVDGWYVGHIENGQVVWKYDGRPSPPEDTERL